MDNKLPSQNADTDAVFHAAALKERELMRTANHLSDGGTFMGLAASAYFLIDSIIEGDRMPKMVKGISLTGVMVGMGAIISSFVVRHHASKVALENDRSWLERQGGGAPAASRG